MVSTNNTFDESMRYIKSFDGFGGTQALPVGETHSLDRFVLASSGVKEFRNQTATADYAMSVLASVYTPGSSKWNIVYDQGAGRIYFRTESQKAIKSFDFTNFNPSCKTPVKVLDMNSGLLGDVTAKFQTFSSAFNNRIIEENTFLTQNLIDLAENYPATTRCLE
jgi:penicillin V acylase-like amidase (Ntn superfamily)